MEYVLVAVVLFVSLLAYFKIANKYNIIDKPNLRSAHTEPTLRGGGIIYWIAFLLIFIQTFPENSYLFIAITLVASVSFIDDIRTLPNKIRLFIQFSAIALVFVSLNVFSMLPIWLIVVAFILFVGIINAYNFMDGINGITGLYTISVLAGLYYVQQYVIKFTNIDLIIYPIITSVVFLFFNFRKKAKCFAGDIGSISIAFWVVFLLLQLMLKTQSLIWIMFILIYGIDTVCTILHRLYLQQNIFKAHRYHYYQLLCNNLKLDHRIVSIFYAIGQLVVSILVIIFYQNNFPRFYYFTLISIFVIVYATKFIIIKKYNLQNP
jgi:UDP-N-acetylmuramyl pentapeptide phosphotransferase/UDP-N-acetylglucosamine-1-phosphate transferase